MDLSSMISIDDLIKKQDTMKRIFFYRICGTGMGAAACLLKEKGLAVEGGDSVYAPPMSDYLKRLKIPCHLLSEVSEEDLKKFDLIVVGNVVPRDGIDAKRIEKSGVPFVSFPQALGALVLRNINVVGIAGTHGKTTTTYLATQLFEKLGENPGYLVGGVIEGRNSAALGNGKYFFIESDEYDSAYFDKISKFRNYFINDLILTSLEYDHADIFANVEAIKDQFRAAMPNIDGKFIFNTDFSDLRNLSEEFFKNGPYSEREVFFYGDNYKPGPRIMLATSSGTTFKINFKEQEYLFKTNITGKQNILNLSATIIYALTEGFTYQAINHAIADLKMVKRRQEYKGQYKGAIFIDDFAHHPSAISITLDAIKTTHPEKNLIAIFEPASATARSAIFEKEYLNVFGQSILAIILRPERETTAINSNTLDVFKLAQGLSAKGVRAVGVESLEVLIEMIENNASDKTIFAFLSN